MNLNRTIVYFLALGNSVVFAFGQNDGYFTLDHTKARPLAMGGAFMAVEDDLAAIGFNPATFSLYNIKKERRVTFFLNPISPFVAAIENKELFSGSGSKIDDYLLSVGQFLKSISFSFDSISFGFLLGEENLSIPQTFVENKIIDISGFRQNHAHQFVAHLRLAEKVSVGGSASLLFRSKKNEPLERETGFGLSYGILLKPEKGLQIGVSFINLADSLREARVPFERLVDESVNVGLSYSPIKGTLFSLDVRNLGEEDSVAVRELHLGLEQVLFSHIAIRAGFYRQNMDNVYSFGVGLVDENAFFDFDNKFGHGNFLINYAYVYEEKPFEDNRWHFLSFLLRL